MTVKSITGLFSDMFLNFDYVNHRGIDLNRTVKFQCLQYGSIPEYYPEPTFLLCGYEEGKGYRSFDISKIRNFKIVE